MQDAVKWSDIHTELVADLEYATPPQTVALRKDSLAMWNKSHKNPDPFAEKEERLCCPKRILATTHFNAATQLRDLEAMYAEADAANDAARANSGYPKSQYLGPKSFIKVGRDLKQ
jgi:hypothetical protein